jgi:hypothetical protein
MDCSFSLILWILLIGGTFPSYDAYETEDVLTQLNYTSASFQTNTFVHLCQIDIPSFPDDDVDIWSNGTLHASTDDCTHVQAWDQTQCRGFLSVYRAIQELELTTRETIIDTITSIRRLLPELDTLSPKPRRNIWPYNRPKRGFYHSIGVATTQDHDIALDLITKVILSHYNVTKTVEQQSDLLTTFTNLTDCFNNIHAVLESQTRTIVQIFNYTKRSGSVQHDQWALAVQELTRVQQRYLQVQHSLDRLYTGIVQLTSGSLSSYLL